MIEALLEVLKRITIFMVMGKIILNLGMGRGYEKYTKIVIGFMVIVQLVAGITSTWNTMKEETLQDTASSFYDSWKKEMKEFESQLRIQQKEIESSWREYGKEEEKKQKEKEEKKNQQRENEEKGIEIEKIQIGKVLGDERTSFTKNKGFVFAKG